MANYFTNIPYIAYISRESEQNSIGDYTVVKNLFKRAKIRDDIFENVSYFNRYQITGNERPDQVANEIYNDPD